MGPSPGLVIKMGSAASEAGHKLRYVQTGMTSGNHQGLQTKMLFMFTHSQTLWAAAACCFRMLRSATAILTSRQPHSISDLAIPPGMAHVHR